MDAPLRMDIIVAHLGKFLLEMQGVVRGATLNSRQGSTVPRHIDKLLVLLAVHRDGGVAVGQTGGGVVLRLVALGDRSYG